MPKALISAVEDAGRWSSEATAFFIAYINVHVKDFQMNINSARGQAAKALTNAFGREYKPGHLDKELLRLWDGRNSQSSKTYKDLYVNGISYTTLPGAAEFGKEFLETVRTRVKQIRYEDRIECMCPFDVDDGHTVQCDSCLAWQHIHCVYESPYALPEKHYCVTCNPQQLDCRDSKGVLTQTTTDADPLTAIAMSKICLVDESPIINQQNRLRDLGEQNEELKRSIQLRSFENSRLKKALHDIKALSVFTTFGLIEETDGLLLGPDDDEIADCIAQTAHDALRVVICLPKGGDILQWGFMANRDHFQPDLFHLLELCLGPTKAAGLTTKSNSARRPLPPLSLETVLRCTIIASLYDWVFCQDSLSSLQTASPMLKALGWVVNCRDGAKALKNLQLAALSHLTTNGLAYFERPVAEEAKNISRRILDALNPLFSAVGTSEYAQDWGQSAQDRIQRLTLLEEIVVRCLRMKARLPMREMNFEMYLPTTGTQFDPATMIQNTSGILDAKKSPRVLLCTSPGFLSWPFRETMKTALE